MAAFNDTDSNNYESSNGSSFAATTNPSTEYATKYSNSTTASSGTKIYDVGKIGDATKEVYVGDRSYEYFWFNDFPSFLNAKNPFLRRGGRWLDGSNAGSFGSDYGWGDSRDYIGFRVVLGL